MYGYPNATRHAVPLIWIVSGLGVWLLGRESFHIGISGLTHGLMFFVIMIGLIRRDALSIALALTVFLLFGGMARGMIPGEPSVSYEYHLFGAIAGVIAAIMLNRLDPRATLSLRSPAFGCECADRTHEPHPTDATDPGKDRSDMPKGRGACVNDDPDTTPPEDERPR